MSVSFPELIENLLFFSGFFFFNFCFDCYKRRAAIRRLMYLNELVLNAVGSHRRRLMRHDHSHHDPAQRPANAIPSEGCPGMHRSSARVHRPRRPGDVPGSAPAWPPRHIAVCPERSWIVHMHRVTV